MVAPIFKFRNTRTRLTNLDATFVYGVLTYDSSKADKTLAQGILPSEVSSVVLTVQIANLTASTVTVSAYVQTSTSSAALLGSARTLVANYPLIGQNSFDPLSGNLVLSEGDQLWVQTNVENSCDVVVSLLEIANATAN